MPYCVHCGNEVAAGAVACPKCGRPPFTALTPPRSGLPKAAWVAIGAGCGLLGLMMAGIVAAILIPNFLDALQKAKQHRTVADMRNVGAALITYAADLEAGVVERPLTTATDASGLAAYLTPRYIATLPAADGWKRPYRFACMSTTGDDACDSFCLASSGRDGAFEFEDLRGYAADPGPFPPSQYNRDIVWCDGSFVRWPEWSGAGAGGQ